MKRIFFLLLLLVSRSVIAQEGNEHLAPFARGAGQTYGVSVRGLDAVGLNPSMLALGTDRKIELSIVPFTAIGVNAGPTLVHLNDISSGFRDSNLASQERSADSSISRGDSTRIAIMDLLSQNKVSSTLDTRVFGISYCDPDLGGFALTWSTHAGLRVSVTDSLVKFLGKAALSNITSGRLRPQTADVRAMWYNDFTLSYARVLLGDLFSGNTQLLGGIGIKYLAGVAMMDLDPESYLAFNYPQNRAGQRIIVNTNYTMRFAYPNAFSTDHLPDGFSFNLLAATTAGSGLGADIGATLGAFDDTHSSPWLLALSVTDIGAIRWTDHTDIRSAQLVDTIDFTSVRADEVNKKLQPLAGNLDTTDAPFSTSLPTTLHAAVALDLAEIGISLPTGLKLRTAAEFALGLTDAIGAPDKGRFGVGFILERSSDVVGFHTAVGYATESLNSDLTFAVGVALWNRFYLDLGTSGLTHLLSSDKASDLAIGMKVAL
jgi:hypothetical protein